MGPISVLIVSFLAGPFFNLAAAAQTAPGQPVVDPPAVTPQSGQVPDNAIFLGNTSDRARTVFIADKSRRTLTVWKVRATGPELVGAYPMDIGKKDGDKKSEGDHRTPEGLYFFQERMEGPGLPFEEYGNRAFTLDYPNYFDRQARKTGSGIWLHAVPDTKSLFRGSRGCVVVRNEIINKLTPMISLHTTPMIILDKVNYVTLAEYDKKKAAADVWLQGWRDAWEKKDLDKYLTHYSDDFRALNMSKNKWREYKQGLNEKYSFIKVRASDTLLIERRDEAVIHFVQDYESDGLKDVGEKSLYVKRATANGSPYEILTELWRPLSDEFLAQKQTAASNAN